MKKIVITARDHFNLAGIIEVPPNAKAIVQISHGAHEHKMRYRYLFDALIKAGYGIIAFDFRGHGQSVCKKHPRGCMYSIDEMIDDMVTVSHYIKEKYPTLPLYMFAHSMGSMFARLYLRDHDTLIDKLILSGSPRRYPLLHLFIPLTQWFVKRNGGRGADMLINYIGTGSLRESKWVSKSSKNRQRIKVDPLCFSYYDSTGYEVLFDCNKLLKDYKSYKRQNPNLPILSMTGQKDPLPGGRRGLMSIKRDLQQYGYNDITFKTYKGLRHEIINEDEHNIVFADIINFYDSNL